MRRDDSEHDDDDKQRTERVHGPYKHGDQWRVIRVDADGSRGRRSFKSEALALTYIRLFKDETDRRTISMTVDEYIAQLSARGMKSVVTVGYRLRGLLQTKEHDRKLASLTPKLAKRLFAERAAKTKTDTQIGELSVASRFATWCVEKGWLPSDPFAGLEATGERARGEPQLRINEARAFIETALADQHPSQSGLPAAMALLMGLRASEVTNRKCRDVDDNGRVLWIDRAKTRKGDRTLEIPVVIRARLVELVKGRPAEELIFGEVDRHWLAYHVERLRKAAKVVRVTPHGLRGTQASISAGAVSVEHVAEALGQTGPAVTRRHYLAKGAEQAGKQRRALTVLQGGAA